MVNDFMEAHPEVNRSVALKFNLGRKFISERVEECYQSYQQTVLEHHLENVTAADVLDEMRTQKMYIPGTRDRNGAALFIINAAKHVPGQYDNEQTLRLAFYMGELLTSSPKTAQVGVTIISNMDGLEWANFDNQFQRNIINFFQASIPARVKNIILYRSPWWVSMLVKMVSPFLKQKMRERIHICDEGDLLQFVEPDQLPSNLGGTFDYDHEAFLKREVAKVPSAVITGTTARPTTEEMAAAETQHRPPPGTVMLVSDEMASRLNEERERVLHELDEKIRRRRESLKEHTLPIDFSKLLRSKTKRMTLDTSIMPTMEPNLLHLRDARIVGPPSLLVAAEVSPLAETPGEDYDDQEALQRRIRESIMEDRSLFLKNMHRHASITGISRGHTNSFFSEEEEAAAGTDEGEKAEGQKRERAREGKQEANAGDTNKAGMQGISGTLHREVHFQSPPGEESSVASSSPSQPTPAQRMSALLKKDQEDPSSILPQNSPPSPGTSPETIKASPRRARATDQEEAEHRRRRKTIVFKPRGQDTIEMRSENV